MRILHDLLEYIDEYFYLKDEEEIIIRYGERAALAKEIYDKAVSFVCEDCSLPEQTQGDTSIQVYRRSAKDKWFLDIAIDCVKKMSEEDKAEISKDLNPSDYHFGYGGWVRDEYIRHCQKHTYLDADDDSGYVIEMILSIVSPEYDYRDSRITYAEHIHIAEVCDSWDLSFRVSNLLKQSGIHTLDDLNQRTMKDFWKIRNLGSKNMQMIIGALKRYGLWDEARFYGSRDN